jgi:hypothetical protein
MTFSSIPRIWLSLCGAVYLVGLLTAVAWAPRPFLLGFAGGGAIVLTNLWASASKVRGAAFPHRGPVMRALIGGFYARLFLVGICLFALISFLEVDPVGLVVGLSVVPAGLFVMLILVYLANRRPEEA